MLSLFVVGAMLVAGLECVVVCTMRSGRRLQVNDTVQAKLFESLDVDLCHSVNRLFAEKFMHRFSKRMQKKGPMAEVVGSIAEHMSNRFHEIAVERECAEESESAEEPEEAGQYRRLDVSAYLKEFERASNFTDHRRMDDVPDDKQRMLEDHIPSLHMMQAAGYAAATAILAEEGITQGADVFAVNSRGSGREKHDGCGSIVRTVNKAVEQSEILSIVKDDGKEIVVVEDEETATGRFGALVTSLTLATGAVVYKLMEVCHSYDVKAALALC